MTDFSQQFWGNIYERVCLSQFRQKYGACSLQGIYEGSTDFLEGSKCHLLILISSPQEIIKVNLTTEWQLFHKLFLFLFQTVYEEENLYLGGMSLQVAGGFTCLSAPSSKICWEQGYQWLPVMMSLYCLQNQKQHVSEYLVLGSGVLLSCPEAFYRPLVGHCEKQDAKTR